MAPRAGPAAPIARIHACSHKQAHGDGVSELPGTAEREHAATSDREGTLGRPASRARTLTACGWVISRAEPGDGLALAGLGRGGGKLLVLSQRGRDGRGPAQQAAGPPPSKLLVPRPASCWSPAQQAAGPPPSRLLVLDWSHRRSSVEAGLLLLVHLRVLEQSPTVDAWARCGK